MELNDYTQTLKYVNNFFGGIGYMKKNRELYTQSRETIVKELDTNKKSLLIKAILDKNVEFIKNSENIKNYIDIKDKKGKTPLMYASEQDNQEIFKMILNKTKKINETDKNDRSALMYACVKGSYQYIKELLDKGANIHQRDRKNRTALIYAAKRARVEAIKDLINAGANVNDMDKYNKNALIYASKCGEKSYKVADELLKAKDIKYVTEVIHLVDMKSFYGIGHCGILIINNTGEGMLYSYGAINNRGNSRKDAVMEIAEEVYGAFNAPLKGKLWRDYIKKEDVDIVKVVDEEDLEKISEQKNDEIFQYTYRIRMKIDDTNPVKVALRGAKMQSFLETLYNQPGIYRIYTKSCVTIVDDVLKEGGLNAPASIIPKRTHILKKNVVNARESWSCPGDYKLVLDRLTR